MSKYGVDYRTDTGKGIVRADGFVGPSDAPLIQSYVGSATLAELNAGKTLIPELPGRTIKIIGYTLLFTGAFTTATDIRLQDTNGTPVVITTVAIAAATAGAKISSEAVVANVTDGAGLFANLTIGKGVKIVKTGSSAAGGTSISIKIIYSLT